MNNVGKNSVVFFVVAVSLFIGFSSLCGGRSNRSAQTQRMESPATAILRDLAAGKSVKLRKFQGHFDQNVHMWDAGGRYVSQDLGLGDGKEGYNTLQPMLDKDNYAVIYVGDANKIPPQLHPTTQPTTTPTTRRTEHLIIEYQPPATEPTELSGGHSPK